MTRDVHTGTCLCGVVAFETRGPPRDVIGCHCTQCRRTSGHYWAATSVPLDRFRLTRAEGLSWFRSSPAAVRGFCRSCGAGLFWRPEGENRIAIAAGAFDGDPPFRLTKHIFLADAGDYYAPVGPPPPRPAGRLDCSCLCGAVAFALPGPAGDVCACHCRQCRRLSGHYSASFNAGEGPLIWARRATLAEYATPAGARRGFCTACGSSLYFRAGSGAFSVEAGAVTGPTGGRLAGHIFTDVKAGCYDIDDGLPQGRSR